MEIKASLNQIEIRTMKTELEDLREAAIQNRTTASTAYADFAEKFADHRQAASNHTGSAKNALRLKSENPGNLRIKPGN